MSEQKKIHPNPEDKISKFSSARKLLLVAFIVALIGGGIYWLTHEEETPPSSPAMKTSAEEPAFKKEGTLYFLNQDSQDTITRIAIEVADNEQEREQGLMNRSQMADSAGMLFIFKEAKPRSFWMKNTKIPLDIMYIGTDKEIVMIYKSVMPYSTQSIPSYKEAQYVVEVNGGYTTTHNIKEGDHVSFEIIR